MRACSLASTRGSTGALTGTLGGEVDDGARGSVASLPVPPHGHVNGVAQVGLQLGQQEAALLRAERVVDDAGQAVGRVGGAPHVHTVPQDVRVARVAALRVPAAPLHRGVVGGDGAVHHARRGVQPRQLCTQTDTGQEVRQ